MKKLLVIVSVICLITSCKKKYDCTCADNSYPPEPDIYYQESYLDTKNNAVKKCADLNVVKGNGANKSCGLN